MLHRLCHEGMVAIVHVGKLVGHAAKSLLEVFNVHLVNLAHEHFQINLTRLIV